MDSIHLTIGVKDCPVCGGCHDRVTFEFGQGPNGENYRGHCPSTIFWNNVIWMRVTREMFNRIMGQARRKC